PPARFGPGTSTRPTGCRRRRDCRPLCRATTGAVGCARSPMQAYIAKRCLLFVPTLLMATLVAFLLLRVIPGDPALVNLAGETGDSSFTQAELDAERAKLGTDRPLYVQYAKWLGGMLRLDFGRSMFFDEPVAKDLAAKFPITLELTILAMLIA